jgi:hypothetical protein
LIAKKNNTHLFVIIGGSTALRIDQSFYDFLKNNGAQPSKKTKKYLLFGKAASDPYKTGLTSGIFEISQSVYNAFGADNYPTVVFTSHLHGIPVTAYPQRDIFGMHCFHVYRRNSGQRPLILFIVSLSSNNGSYFITIQRRNGNPSNKLPIKGLLYRFLTRLLNSNAPS